MLKAHQNLQYPRPSDRLRVGDCIVDLSLREISRDTPGSEPTRISVKAQDVLIALIAHAGKVVSREALLEWVWPDTMPNDDVVTQAITLLRKTFGDTREQTAYIETISKHGYRLVAPLEWILPADIAMDGQAAASQDAVSRRDESRTNMGAEPPRAVRWRRPIVSMSVVRISIVRISMVLISIVALFVLGVWMYGGGRQFPIGLGAKALTVSTVWPEPTRAFQRVASTPESEIAPSLSPDGALMVYSRRQVKGHGASLVVQPSTALPPKPITETVPGRVDTWPAWSPDGRQIAFVRNDFVAANQHRCVVMLISAIGSGERELAPCLADSAHPISWYPDGSALIAANGYPSRNREKGSVAIHRLPLRTGHWERIEYTKEATDDDSYPVVSPDGRWIAFYRSRATGGLWRIPATGGSPRLILALPDSVKGLAWLPDSEHLIFSRLDRSASKPARLSRIRIDGTGLSDYALEREGIFAPSTALTDGAVAFEIENTRAVLHRIRIDDRDRQAQPTQTPVFDSSLSTLFPSLSPDGTQIVFVSDRSGSYALWWAELSQPESLRPLEGISPAAMHPVVWDVESKRILAIGEVPGGNAIFEIEPRTSHIRRLPFAGKKPLHAAYHPDQRRLLVVSAKPDGDTRLVLYDRSSEPWWELASIESDVQMSAVDPGDGRILFAKTSTPEIWQTDLLLRQSRLAGSLQEKVRNKTLIVAADGAWVLDGQADCTWSLRPILRSLSADGRQARCLGRQMPKPVRGIGYDAVRGELYVSTVNKITLDIGLLTAPGKSSAGR